MFKFNLTLLIIAVVCITGIFGRQEQVQSCKQHGAACNVDSECCNNAVCHRYAKQCQVRIDGNMLQDQHNRLRPVDSNRPSIPSASAVRPPAQPALRGCKQHGDPCTSSSECCGTTVCHLYAQRCQVPIDANMLQEQRSRLRHVEPNRPSASAVRPPVQPSSANCKRHGDPCVSSSECCSNAVCHRYAQRCQIQIDADMLQDQRNRLRHVDNQYH